MIKVIKMHYDNSTIDKKDIVKEVMYYPDLKIAFENIRNQIIEMENLGKENYWCMKSNTEVFFWNAKGNKDYTTWSIEECK